MTTEKPDLDWKRIKADVCSRIDLLQAAYEHLEGEFSEKIKSDLVVPCLDLLAQFIDCVKITIEEEPDDEPTPEQIQRPPLPEKK